MTTSKPITIFLLACFAMLTVSISSYAQESDSLSSAMFDKILELKEFKIENERVERLAEAGKDIILSISIPVEPLDPKDRENGILRVYINQREGFEEIVLYEIQFDRKTEKILHVERKQE